MLLIEIEGYIWSWFDFLCVWYLIAEIGINQKHLTLEYGTEYDTIVRMSTDLTGSYM